MDRSLIWNTVHDERRALVRDLAGLSDEDWSRDSWAAGWTIADVVAHLVDSNTTTRLGFVRRLAAARGDFDRATAEGVARERRFRHRDLLGAYRSTIELTATPPADLRSRLVEEVAHGEDLRRPLGLVREYPLKATLPALQYLVKTPAALGGGAAIARGLTLVATDAGLRRGSGPEVLGSSVSLLLALTGRRVHESELAGPGRAELLSRITPH
ncbi:maleylpyruvate isomerase family mycothiol-dependent enzyme [Aestuariimicrobium soli]|uniref:maleylpyruvate isomerase family mycothiol-dependent enzyme n=1 Tax=Aestuariimicrobium soli TaxID=2035834 RepID=UPI003EBABB69